MRHVRRSMCGSFVIALMCACGALSLPRIDAAEQNDNVIETFDVARNGDVLLLPVVLGDQQYRFMIGTCDTYATVDAALRSKLVSVGTSANIRGKQYDIYRFEATLFGESHLSVTGDEAVCDDLSLDRKIYGHDIRGKLGMNFLKQHVITIDFDTGKLSILKAVSASAGSEFQIIYDAWEWPRLRAKLDEDETVALVIDLENATRGDISLRDFHVDDLIEKGRLDLRAPPTWRWIVDSTKFARRGWLDRISLGEFTHEQVAVGEGSHNTLGLSLLSRYIVTLDFPNNRLYLKKGTRFAEPQRTDLSGLILARVGDEARIESVRPDTPAAAAGLQANDKILKFNGHSASSLSLFELRSLLMTDGARIQLDVTGLAGRRQVAINLAITRSTEPAVTANADPADNEAEARDAQSIHFEGADSFDAEKIRKKLALDIDFQVASHPKNPLSLYLTKIEELLISGYRASGFPEARATVRFDTNQRRVIVRLHEGARYRCSKVLVTGLDARESAAVVAELTQEVPPPCAVPVDVSRDDGTTQTVWETVTGSQVKLLKPLWKVGAPASFDYSLLTDVGKRLTYWFWARGRVLADFTTQVKIEDGSDNATLVVAVADPGVQATIGEIEVNGAQINSVPDVLEFLSIGPGMPFNGCLQSQLEHRLWKSGRLISARINQGDPVRTEHGARVNLTIVICENRQATPLSIPLEPCEQALLKLRDWVVQWTNGLHDEDLVIDGLVNPLILDDENSETDAKSRSNGRLYEVHSVTSPRNGQVIAIQIRQDEKPVFAQTFIARDGRAIFHSPLTATHLEFEHSNSTQLTSRVEVTTLKPKSPSDRTFRFNFGMGVKSNASGDATALKLQTRLAPLAVLDLSKKLVNAECKTKAGILTMQAEGFDVQIDERTGRLIEFHVTTKELGAIHCRTARGALQPEFNQQERLMVGSLNVFNTRQPESSLAVYWIDEYRRFCQGCLSPERQESLAALQKLCRNWSIAPVLELFSHFGDDDASPDAFGLTKKQVQWAHPAMAPFDYDGAGTTVGYLLPLYRKLVPRTGWLWPVGRDGLFALMGRPIGAWDDIGQSQDILNSGPLGHLATALVLAPFSPQMSKKLARQAMKRTTAKLLGADCAPLLAGDSWLGRNVVSLTDALRHLDDSEIESLVRLVPDQSHHREIADSLLLLKADCERPVGEVLLDVCNQLWQRTLKASVEKTLTALAAWKSTGGSSAFQDLKLDPFKIGPTTDAVISGPNIPDFKFEPKDQEFKFDLKKKSFEKERFKIPDFRVENTSEAK